MGRTVTAAECGTTALSIEFVSKPQEAYRLRAAVPAAIDGALGHRAGFAGCMLLISDKESRLVTVVIFWEGENRAALCSEAAAWVHEVLTPFIDHCLQMLSYDAYLPDESAGFAKKHLWRWCASGRLLDECRVPVRI